jgi:hypothetical protein
MLGPPPMMSWGGSPAVGQPLMWPSPPCGYWPPPPLGGYWPPPLLASLQARVPALLPTFRPRILAATTVGTSSWRASPAVGNASMDDTDTDAVAAATFFFTTDDKSSVPTFNCSIHNTTKCRTSHVLVHLCLQASFVGRT